MDKIPKSIEPEGMFSGLKVKAVAAGVLADFASTIIFGMILMFVILISEFGAEIPDEAIDNFLEVKRNLYLLFLLGMSCTAFGGFIGAKIAGTLEIRHGGWVGAFSLILSMIMEVFLDQTQQYPQWYIYCSIAAMIPAGVLGGYLSSVLSKEEEPS